MPVANTELIAYAAASMPVTDAAASGGAIDPLRRVVFTDLAANDDVEVISSSAGDVQNCTIVGRNAAGSEVIETAALTGTAAKIFATLGVIERIQSVELASAAVGTITVRRSVAGATISTIVPGERGFMRLFRNSSSDPSATRTYHEKFFWKNTNGSLALLGASLSEAADPTGLVDFALESTINGSGSIANRLAVPGAIAAAFSNAAKLLSTAGAADLAAGSAIGVWVRLSLAIANAPIKSTWTSQIDGTST